MAKHVVRLSGEERTYLKRMVSTGKRAARAIIHARILLQADEGEFGPGLTDTEVSTLLGIGLCTVSRVRKRLVEDGLEAAIERKKYEAKAPRRKVDGELEARLLAMSCSRPPEGFKRWSLRLLADRVVELGYIDTISHEAVRRALKKTN